MVRRLRRVICAGYLYDMKKILITEAQLKMLEDEGWKYSSEKIDEIVVTAKKELDNGKKQLSGVYNSITMLSIGEIMDDTERFENFVKDIENRQKHYEALYNKYYDIVEMYDFMDLPDNVKDLEDINRELDDVQNSFYKLADSAEEIVDNIKRLADLNISNENMQSI